jgi:hypothetical protein
MREVIRLRHTPDYLPYQDIWEYPVIIRTWLFEPSASLKGFKGPVRG